MIWKVRAESDLYVSCWITEVLVGGSAPKPQVFSLWPVCNRVWVVSMLGRVQTEKLGVRRQRVAVVLGRGLSSLSGLATTTGSTPHVILIRGLCKSYLNTTLITLFRNIHMCGRVPGTGFPQVLGVRRRHRVCRSVTGTGGGSLWDKSGSPSWVPGSWLALVGLAVLGTTSCGIEELVALRRSECSQD